MAEMPATTPITAGKTRLRIGIANDLPAEPNKSNGAFSTGVIMRRVVVASLEVVTLCEFVMPDAFSGAAV